MLLLSNLGPTTLHCTGNLYIIENLRVPYAMMMNRAPSIVHVDYQLIGLNKSIKCSFIEKKPA